MPISLKLPHHLHPSRAGIAPAVMVAALLAGGGCSPSEDGRAVSDDGAAMSSPGTDRGEAAGSLEAELWLDDVRIGHEVGSDGAVPIAQQADEFTPGERVYVSVEVSDAPEYAAVHVVFHDAAGETVAEDEKKVPAAARHLYFDSGDTTEWEPGGYRVVVAVEGEPVAERELTVTEGPLATQAEAR